MYDWLNNEPGPKMLKEALSHLGLKERTSTGRSDPTILGWAQDLGLGNAYTNTSIPWCGLFMAHCAKAAGWSIPNNPLWARSWSTWEKAALGGAMLGDVLVFARDGGGHVGQYVGEDDQCFHVLGGNQGDAVSIKRIAKDRLLAARRPRWKLAKPENVRRIILKPTGVISKNEA